MKKQRALFVGRFQPLHLGHYKVIKNLLKKYYEIIIVVGSSNESKTSQNPFTAGERIELIRSAFGKEDLTRMIVVPIADVNDHKLWPKLVLEQTPEFGVVFSNNELVRELFQNAGVKTKPIKFINLAAYEGNKIRELMRNNRKEWKKLVPKKTIPILEKLKSQFSTI